MIEKGKLKAVTTTDYFQMYLEKVNEIGFSEPHIAGIVRYLLVNGHIEATPENLALMGDTEFYLDAEHMPEQLKKQALEHYENFPENADFDEELEIEEIEIHGHKLEGAWICNGNMTGFKVCVTRTVKVESTYNCHEPTDEELSEADDPDCQLEKGATTCEGCPHDGPHEGECKECGYDYDPETGICQHCGYRNFEE